MDRNVYWDLWFLGLAKYVSSASKDPSTKVGSVIIDDQRRVVSMGYNGFPKGVRDDDERLNNRELKYKIVVHAERNALLFSNKSNLTGCCIYVYPMMPCSVCASMIIQTGISKVVAPENDNPRWIQDFQISKGLFEESGVVLVLYPESDLYK